MNRNVLIAIGIVLVLGIGAFAYMGMTDNDDNDTNTNQANTGQNNDGETPQFNPAATTDRDFVGTISGSGQEGTVVFEYDNDSESFRYVATANGEGIETITTPDAYYAMANGQWIKYPTGTDSGFDADDYQYGNDELEDYRNSSAYQGTQQCSAGTCHVWQTTIGNSQSTLLIDTDTGYIVRVSTTAGDQTSAIDYEYKEVTITAPTDAQEIELPS